MRRVIYIIFSLHYFCPSPLRSEITEHDPKEPEVHFARESIDSERATMKSLSAKEATDIRALDKQKFQSKGMRDAEVKKIRARYESAKKAALLKNRMHLREKLMTKDK